MNITINNKKIEAKMGETILDVCKRENIKIPTLCFMADMFPTGSCRMCVVEVEGQKALRPSCAARVEEGMVVNTHSIRVLRARKTLLELVMADHPDDCLYCSRSGNCELRTLSEDFGIRERTFKNTACPAILDDSAPSVLRDTSKCVLCGRCVRICEEVQGVSAIDFIHRGSHTMIAPFMKGGLNTSSCVHCGQCIMGCPTGALTEKDAIRDVMNALADKDKFVVVQHAPSISVTIGEYFDLDDKVHKDVSGLLNAGLYQLGFKRVFDTSFSADLTIMEEATELIERIKKNDPLPMFTSCSPGWVKFVEQFYPSFIPHLSSCKSPQQMMGAVIKSYYAKKFNIDPSKIYSVSVMPCTAKKFERDREGMRSSEGGSDVDAVLTTRELAKMFKLFDINLGNLEAKKADHPLGEHSSAGKIFGVTGGVMEAAVRTAYHMLTGKRTHLAPLKEVRDLAGVKETEITINDLKIKVAVVSGLQNARFLLDEIKNKRRDYHFVEVMTCPGGCIAGGGQPIGLDSAKVKQRMAKLYQFDETSALKTSFENTDIQKLYKEFFQKPGSHLAHELLHTHYLDRSKEK